MLKIARLGLPLEIVCDVLDDLRTFGRWDIPEGMSEALTADGGQHHGYLMESYTGLLPAVYQGRHLTTQSGHLLRAIIVERHVRGSSHRLSSGVTWWEPPRRQEAQDQQVGPGLGKKSGPASCGISQQRPMAQTQDTSQTKARPAMLLPGQDLLNSSGIVVAGVRAQRVAALLDRFDRLEEQAARHNDSAVGRSQVLLERSTIGPMLSCTPRSWVLIPSIPVKVSVFWIWRSISQLLPLWRNERNVV